MSEEEQILNQMADNDAKSLGEFLQELNFTPLDEMQMKAETFAAFVERLTEMQIKAEKFTALVDALEGVEHLLLTGGHPEFGIECSITIGDDWVTVINQPDEVTAIINARRELEYQKIPDEGLKKIGEYNSQFFRKDDEGDE